MMSPDLAALIALGLYLLIALALTLRSAWRCPDGFGVWFLYAVARLYAPLMFRWRARNPPCPFPAAGGALLIVNHRSPADPIFVWVNHHLRTTGPGQPRVIAFLTAAEYCTIPGLTWLVRTMQTIPVRRDGTDMSPVREALRRLKEGRLIGIFPEGQLNRGRNLLPAAGTGAAFIALKANVPVIPVFIHDAPQHPQSMIAPFLMPARVTVTYGERIDLSPWSDRRLTSEVLDEVTNLLMSRLAALEQPVEAVALRGTPLTR